MADRQDVIRLEATRREFRELLTSQGWARLVKQLEDIGESILVEIQKPVDGVEAQAKHNVAVGRLLAIHQIAGLPDQLARNATMDLDDIAKHTPKLMENEDVEARPPTAAP